MASLTLALVRAPSRSTPPVILDLSGGATRETQAMVVLRAGTAVLPDGRSNNGVGRFFFFIEKEERWEENGRMPCIL
jgi:hypothetical protein